MKKLKRFKNKQVTDTEINMYCLSVEEVLKTINDRCCHKKSRQKKEKKTAA